MTDQIPSPRSPLDPDQRSRWVEVPRWFLGAAGVLLIAIFAGVLFLLFRDTDDVVETAQSTTSVDETTSTSGETTTTTTEATTTSTGESTTAPTTTEPTTTSSEPDPDPTSTIPAEFATAVWPWFASDIRYDDPLEAATGFAEDYLGFVEPIVGEFRRGDSRSGEVEVRPVADGPVTTVLVRQLGPRSTWWVLGAVSANIVVETPDALCEVSSPLTVAGSALAFEGVVEVQVRADGVVEALATTNVIGGGSELAPFTGELTFVDPDGGSGAIVLLSRDARDGGVWEASVIRISFGSGGC